MKRQKTKPGVKPTSHASITRYRPAYYELKSALITSLCSNTTSRLKHPADVWKKLTFCLSRNSRRKKDFNSTWFFLLTHKHKHKDLQSTQTLRPLRVIMVSLMFIIQHRPTRIFSSCPVNSCITKQWLKTSQPNPTSLLRHTHVICFNKTGVRLILRVFDRQRFNDREPVWGLKLTEASIGGLYYDGGRDFEPITKSEAWNRSAAIIKPTNPTDMERTNVVSVGLKKKEFITWETKHQSGSSHLQHSALWEYRVACNESNRAASVMKCLIIH